jgi:TPR repeat protein
MLVRRAHVFLENGDISAARLLLRRAAEAGDVRATLALATTYDPVVLRQIGALGAKDDIAQARHWYQKASELGSAEAVMRLQRLAQETR